MNIVPAVPASASGLIDLAATCAKVSLKKTSIYELIRKGHFPKPIHPGGLRAVRWVEAEVDAWISDQIAAERVRMDGQV